MKKTDNFSWKKWMILRKKDAPQKTTIGHPNIPDIEIAQFKTL